MGQAIYNQPVSPTAAFTSCFEQYDRALETLACRILAEPYNAHRVEADIHPAMLGGGLFGQIVAECVRQFRQFRRYTPKTISEAIGVKMETLYHFAMKDPDMDLPFAFDMFRQYYGRYVEAQIADFTGGWLMQGLGADEIRVQAEKMRKEKGMVAKQMGSDGKIEFESALLASLDGKVVDYPVKPPITKLRKLIPYHEPGEYIIIAGRTGMGKSYMAMNYIYEHSLRGIPTTYINLENTPMNVQKRIWQMHSRVKWEQNLSGIGDAESVRLLQCWEDVKKMPFRSQNTGRNLHTILNTIRQEYYERGIALAVIDYIQLMREQSIKGNRVNELGEISAEVRALCLELNIPLIALAQISRSGEDSGDRRPSLSHLRGSGDLEQDAATVMLLYRPGYYNIATNADGIPYPEDYADIHIAKGRETGTAFAECGFDPVRGFYDREEFPAPASPQFPTSTNHYPPASARQQAREQEFDMPF